MAWMVTAMVTALLFIAAVVASAVCAVVFPEYCVDEVRWSGRHCCCTEISNTAFHWGV